MNHKEKIKLAKKLNTFTDKDGKKHVRQSGLMIAQQGNGQVFYNRKWEKHREAVANRVEKRNARIQAGVQKKKEEQKK